MSLVPLNTKLTFLFPFIFIVLFGGSIYGDEPEVKKEYWRNGKLRNETYYKFGKVERLETWFYRTGEKLEEVPWKNGKKEGLVTSWTKDGRKKYETHWKNGIGMENLPFKET